MKCATLNREKYLYSSKFSRENIYGRIEESLNLKIELQNEKVKCMYGESTQKVFVQGNLLWKKDLFVENKR